MPPYIATTLGASSEALDESVGSEAVLASPASAAPSLLGASVAPDESVGSKVVLASPASVATPLGPSLAPESSGSIGMGTAPYAAPAEPTLALESSVSIRGTAPTRAQ